MIVFLYGPDGYRLKQNGNVVLDNYRKKHPGGIFFKFDLSNSDELAKIENAVKSGSLFGEMKLIVLKNVFFKKTDSDRIEELIRTQNILKAKDVVLLFIENQKEKELTKHKALFNLLAGKDSIQSNSVDPTMHKCGVDCHQKGQTLGGASNIIRNIEYLEGEKLAKWIKGEVALRQCSIELDAIKKLITTTGNESWALVNEIDKLCNFKMGGVIKKEDVALLGFKKIDLNIFDFVDAIAGKNKARAYEILFKEIKNGRDLYYLLTMIVYQFRNLIIVKDLQKQNFSELEIAKKTKIHPFVVKKAIKSPIQFDEAKRMYGRLLAMDTGFKTGQINLEDSLFGIVTL